MWSKVSIQLVNKFDLMLKNEQVRSVNFNYEYIDLLAINSVEKRQCEKSMEGAISEIRLGHDLKKNI